MNVDPESGSVSLPLSSVVQDANEH